MVPPASHLETQIPDRGNDFCSQSPAVKAEIDRFRPAIHSYLKRRGFNGDDVEDLTQETFVRAVLHLEEFRGGNLGGWLYRIAGNLAIDHLRRQQRTAMLSLDWAHLEPAAAGNPETAFFELGYVVELNMHLEALKPDQQELIRLRFQETQSVREIAERLNCSPGAAKLRLFRAVEALRKRCADIL